VRLFAFPFPSQPSRNEKKEEKKSTDPDAHRKRGTGSFFLNIII